MPHISWTEHRSHTTDLLSNHVNDYHTGTINVEETSTNASFYPLFASATSGDVSVKSDNALSYNPSTNTLNVANLNGNASTATVAADANQVNILSSTADTTHYPTFVKNITGYNDVEVDTNFTYIPSNGTFKIGNTVKVDGDSLVGQVAIGTDAGLTSQGVYPVAIGFNAGKNNQGNNAIAIGQSTGLNNQGTSAIAIGRETANSNQGPQAIAIGRESGKTDQNGAAISIGYWAGEINQGVESLAIGVAAGRTSQSAKAIAIGQSAGATGQGLGSIAIGSSAGFLNQHANSIVINATGAPLNSNAASQCIIAPLRNDVSKHNQLQYNTTNKEVSYVAQVISPLTSSGLDITGSTALLAATAGGTSGQHLVIRVNNVAYKIALLST